MIKFYFKLKISEVEGIILYIILQIGLVKQRIACYDMQKTALTGPSLTYIDVFAISSREMTILTGYLCDVRHS